MDLTPDLAQYCIVVTTMVPALPEYLRTTMRVPKGLTLK